jgi:hypothetical protein
MGAGKGRRFSRVIPVVLAGTLLLAGCGAGTEPEPEVTFRVETSEQTMRAYADCLSDRGWSVKYNAEDNTIDTTGVTEALREKYAADDVECDESTGVSSEIDEMTSVTATQYYRFLVDEVTPCVETAGYEVPEPPSEAAFVETQLSGTPAGDFDPYASVRGDREAIAALEKECGVYPDGWG